MVDSPYVLVITPDYEVVTQTTSYFKKFFFKQCAKTFPLLNLSGADACRNKVIPAMNNAIFVSAVGHGNASQYAGQNDEDILWFDYSKRELNFKEVDGKHMHFLSCLVGKRLAPELAKLGAIVTAYTEDYYFIIGEHLDKNMISFFDSDCQIDLELMDGKTHQEAFEAAKQRYLFWIGQKIPKAYIRYLIWDMQHLELFGDGSKHLPTIIVARISKKSC